MMIKKLGSYVMVLVITDFGMDRQLTGDTITAIECRVGVEGKITD